MEAADVDSIDPNAGDVFSLRMQRQRCSTSSGER